MGCGPKLRRQNDTAAATNESRPPLVLRVTSHPNSISPDPLSSLGHLKFTYHQKGFLEALHLPNVPLDHLTAVHLKVTPHQTPQLFIYVAPSVTRLFHVNVTYGALSC